jgi:hypothetical protein
MPKLAYPITQAGLEVPVLIGLDGQDTSDLVAAGKPIPLPVQARGLIDTGSGLTAVAPWVLQALGVKSRGQVSTLTAGGQTSVQPLPCKPHGCRLLSPSFSECDFAVGVGN